MAYVTVLFWVQIVFGNMTMQLLRTNTYSDSLGANSTISGGIRTYTKLGTSIR